MSSAEHLQYRNQAAVSSFFLLFSFFVRLFRITFICILHGCWCFCRDLKAVDVFLGFVAEAIWHRMSECPEVSQTRFFREDQYPLRTDRGCNHGVRAGQWLWRYDARLSDEPHVYMAATRPMACQSKHDILRWLSGQCERLRRRAFGLPAHRIHLHLLWTHCHE